MVPPPQALLERLTKWKQHHLLTFWDDLNIEQQKAFSVDIESADIEKINEIYDKSLTGCIHTEGYTFVAPTPITWSDDNHHSSPTHDVCVLTRLVDVPKDIVDAWYKTGLQLISREKVGAVIMAGGQGTRLGWNAPKGTYPIGPISEKSLFQIFCERYSSVRRLAQKTFLTASLPSIPFYIMTATDNHDCTLAFFKEHDYFGIPKEDIIFFQQQTIPCLSMGGKILLQEKGKIARNPNGNGGVFISMRVTGMIDDMKRRGIEGLHVFGVDNALVKVLDPTFIGYVNICEAPVGNKCVMKSDPDERVGMMCKRRPKISTNSESEVPVVVEYSDLPFSMRHKRVSENHSSSLVFSAGNICNHYFRVDFIESLLDSKELHKKFLPHVANKQIPHIDITTGQLITPASNNGIKFEYFIFDSFMFASKVVGLEVPRETDFSPVKNAAGDDSPASCREIMSGLYKMWLARNKVASYGDGILEISPLVSYDGEGLEHIKSVTLPAYISEPSTRSIN